MGDNLEAIIKTAVTFEIHKVISYIVAYNIYASADGLVNSLNFQLETKESFARFLWCVVEYRCGLERIVVDTITISVTALIIIIILIPFTTLTTI
jgi:hypothetical protein